VDDHTVFQTLRNFTHSAIFTGDDDKLTILTSGIRKDELDKQKKGKIDAVDRKEQKGY
jgi:hypothetical protein